jgi:DNA-binding CsgD family transcriptional regulator
MAIARNGKSKHGIHRETRIYPAIAEVGMVILDESFRPIAFDRGAAEMFRQDARLAVGSTAPVFSLPKELVDVIRRFTPGDPSAPKIHFRLGSGDYSCRSYFLEPTNHSHPGGLVAVHLERDAAAYDAVSEVGSEYRLTDREHEVLKQIAAGLTSKEVAQRMSISPNTVKVFLRMIMMKMGVSTRSGVIAKLLERTDAR